MKQPISHVLYTLLLLLFSYSSLYAQDKITVDATGEIRIPADRVILQIRISATAETPDEAFREHKRQEEILAKLIQEYHLEEELSSFEPVTIGSRSIRDGRQFVTSQSVRLTLIEFTLFEEIQLILIRNGFENFSGNFTSSELGAAQREALDLALSVARVKADQIATTLEREVKSVHSVTHSSHQVMGYQGLRMADMRLESASMMDFDATIPVNSSVTVVFHLSKSPLR